MSTRLLTDWLSSWMKYTENTEPPRLYNKWCGISAIAAALQRKCYLPWGTKKIFPNLYVVLVGPSGCRKGTAMAPAREMLNQLGIRVAADATSPSKLINYLLRSSGDSVSSTKDNQLMSFSTHCSITVFSEELSVFLGYGNSEMIGYLCDWYDCKEVWTYATRSYDEETITNMWVNLIGATTPEVLRVALPVSLIGTGLASRIIFVYEERKHKLISFPFLTEEMEQLGKSLLTDLRAISTMKGAFIPTTEYLLRYDEYYRQSERKPPIIDPRFAGYLSRRMDHLRKLSIIVGASHGTQDLDIEHLEEAINILELTEVNMPNTFVGFGTNPLASIQQEVAKLVAYKGRVSINELTKTFLDDASYDDLAKVLASLSMAGVIGYSEDKQFIEFRSEKKK